MPDATLAECLVEIHDGEVDLASEVYELALLSIDEDRVWWRDLEHEVLMGENIYERIFSEWSRISRGAFPAEGIHESWEREAGPVTVSFLLHGREHRLTTDMLEWIDLGLLDGVNRLIESTGYYFESDFATGDQTACVMVLTHAEKARIADERPLLFGA